MLKFAIPQLVGNILMQNTLQEITMGYKYPWKRILLLP